MVSASGFKGLDRWPSIPLELGDQAVPMLARFDSLFHYLIQLGAHVLKVHDVVNNILTGKMNNTGTVTLAASVATTTLNDVRIGGTSVVLVSPTTAHAAAELPTLWFGASGKQTVVINHANNAQADRTFNYAIIG